MLFRMVFISNLSSALQVTSFQALCTALQHPAVTADPQTVCCVLQTCRSWRAAVQQAAAGTTIIDLHSLHSIAKLSQFAAWIPRHAGMLAELFLTVPQSGCEGLSAESYATAAEQVLLLALQNTAAAAGAHAVFPASPASPRPAVLQPLRLRVFSTDFLSGPGLLAALPAATLTSLGVKHMQGYPSANSTAISHALAGLTALRHLTLENYNCEHGKLAGNCLQAVAKLACLTSLRLSWVAADADLALLPQTLQELRLAACCGAAPLKLQHLTGVCEHRACWLLFELGFFPSNLIIILSLAATAPPQLSVTANVAADVRCSVALCVFVTV